MNNKELIAFAYRWCEINTKKRIDVDNASYDCVDVPKKFMMSLGCTGNLSTGINAAKGYWTHTTDDILKHFVKIKPIPLAKWELFLQPGDIVVWNGTEGNPKGHVAVCSEIGDDGFYVLEQNTWTQEPAKIRYYSSIDNVLGTLRFKTEDEEDEEIIQQGLDDMYGEDEEDVQVGLQNIPAIVLDKPLEKKPKQKAVKEKVADGIIKHTTPAAAIIFIIHTIFPEHIITPEETALVMGLTQAGWSTLVNIFERFLHIDIGLNK